MTIRRLTRSDLHAGEALAWDVFGENGALLVRKGFVPASETQVDSLAERGFVDNAVLHGTDATTPPPSVLARNSSGNPSSRPPS